AYIDDSWSFDIADRLLFYPPYNQHYPEKQMKLLLLWDELGIPHKKEKQLFSSRLKIIGFDVDPNAMTATMPDEAKADLIQAFREFIRSPPCGSCRHSLCDFQQIIGWVNWSLNVYPLVKPALCHMYEKIRGKVKPLVEIFINKHIHDDLSWLANRLEKANGVYFFEAVDW
ncbi:hypothetical protein JAAARDRAFT_109352, partial [Jaapia argillacea MUCL 33604]